MCIKEIRITVKVEFHKREQSMFVCRKKFPFSLSKARRAKRVRISNSQRKVKKTELHRLWHLGCPVSPAGAMIT